LFLGIKGKSVGYQTLGHVHLPSETRSSTSVYRFVADVLSAQSLRRKIPIPRLKTAATILIFGFKLKEQSRVGIYAHRVEAN